MEIDSGKAFGTAYISAIQNKSYKVIKIIFLKVKINNFLIWELLVFD